MEKHTSVESYIASKPQWEEELILLRSIVLSRNLIETIKWGAPVYTTRNGKNIIGLGAFKEYVGVWFYQGALLKDEEKLLLNAQEGKTKAMRQWRFDSLDAIKKDKLSMYIDEAIENQLAGNEIKPDRKSNLIIPVELMDAFKKDSRLKENFELITPYKQREYIEYVSEAKRIATKEKRLIKIIPMIIKGIGLYDKYRK